MACNDKLCQLDNLHFVIVVRFLIDDNMMHASRMYHLCLWLCRISPSNAKDHCHTHATPALKRFQSETLLLWGQRSVSIHSYPRNCISETPPLLKVALLSWMYVRWGKIPLAIFSILKIGFVGSTRPKFSTFFLWAQAKFLTTTCVPY